MNYDNIKFQLDAEHRRCIVGQESMIFHCHHYNNYLQRTIKEDAPYVDSKPFLVGAAAEVSFHQLKHLFASVSQIEERKELASKLFQWAGFGLVSFANLADKGGLVKSPITHYSRTWLTKFGKSEYPVDFFATGWIAGALAAIYDLPIDSFSSNQTKCLSKGDSGCEFEVKREKANFKVFKSVGVGKLTTHKPIAVEKNNVDYDGIFGALTGMPIVGNDEGMIPAFGVYLTRHYANYYNRISFEFVASMLNAFGPEGLEAAEPLLVEAGHVCAFNTFGGIMTSQEWDALIKPQLKSKEDWVHGIVACVNALGWGRWQVTNVSEKGADFYLFDDYESVGYEAMYGKSSRNVCYLAQGGVAGILNLVYLGNIHNKPELTPSFYSDLFKNKGCYTARVITCSAKGDSCTKIEVRI